MIRVVEGDLADLAVDAVVRLADEWLAPLGPASERLDRQAGERFSELCQLQTPLAVGAAVVTGAGNLAAEFVLHVVVQAADRPAARDTLERALASAWHRAEGWQLSTIAIAPFGVGPEGLGLKDVVALLVSSFRDRPGTTGYPAELQLVVAAGQRPAVEELLREGGAP